MEYLSPSKCPRFEVTDSLKVSNIDVGGALNSLLSGLNTLSANDVNFKNIDCITVDATGNVTAATPTAAGHLTTKAYVDGLTFLIAGTGLTRSGNTVSVNAAQSQITSVGTLTSLNVSGAVTVPTPTLAAHAATKAYVDGLSFLTASTGLTLNSGSLSVNASQTQITSVGTLSSLAVSGTATIGTPTLAAHAATKHTLMV